MVLFSITLRGARLLWPAARSSLQTQQTMAVHNIAPNLKLIMNDADARLQHGTPAVVSLARDKPLVLLLPWLMAEARHTSKYVEFYTGQGFDVLTACTTPMNVLWPKTGVQVVARQLVDFFHVNTSYRPLLLHGFSAGGYVWGETCLVMNENLGRYQHVVDRFVGQVWDSVVEFTQSSEGFPRALFPKSKLLQALSRNFMKSYMSVFYQPVTSHYIRASQMYHANLPKSPALFFLSKTDPVATVASVRVARDNWDAMGVDTYWKVWDRSPHVKHYMYHPEEYETELKLFLDKIGLLYDSGRIKSKL